MTIRAEPSVGYEIDASRIPELNRRLSDKILVALNLAQANEENEVVRVLEEALSIAERKKSSAPRPAMLTQFPIALAA